MLFFAASDSVARCRPYSGTGAASSLGPRYFTQVFWACGIEDNVIDTDERICELAVIGSAKGVFSFEFDATLSDPLPENFGRHPVASGAANDLRGSTRHIDTSPD